MSINKLCIFPMSDLPPLIHGFSTIGGYNYVT